MTSAAASEVTAVIAAAGSGERLRAGGPKAFVPLAGRPMVEWSLEAFRSAGVAAIVVAVPPGHDYDPPPGAVPVTVVSGGQTRSESVANSLAVVEGDLVAIHDAARPLLTPALVGEVVATLAADPEAAAAIAATPVTDTIKRADGATGAAAVVGETLDRAGLWAAQTPQVFRAGALREALAGDPEGISAATDEAMLVEAAGGRVLIHPSPPENLKVTTPLDLRLAELLLGQG